MCSKNQQVILGKNIASLYEVLPIRLREQVQRNIERFPSLKISCFSLLIPSRTHQGADLQRTF